MSPKRGCESKIRFVGLGGRGGGGQDGCEGRIEVFVKIQKKYLFIFFFWGGGGVVRLGQNEVVSQK